MISGRRNKKIAPFFIESAIRENWVIYRLVRRWLLFFSPAKTSFVLNRIPSAGNNNKLRIACNSTKHHDILYFSCESENYENMPKCKYVYRVERFFYTQD